MLRYRSLIDISVVPGMFGLVFGLFGMLVYDGERVRESGMLQGYNTVTWTVVALQVTTWERRVSQINCPSSQGDRVFICGSDGGGVFSHRVVPSSICCRVFVVSPGAGRSGHSGGHQVCGQHPQRLRHVALHHSFNPYIILLAAGL